MPNDALARALNPLLDQNRIEGLRKNLPARRFKGVPVNQPEDEEQNA